MHAALKKNWGRCIFDTNFAADLTIMEEGNELVQRIATAAYTMFTSAVPDGSSLLTFLP
jgi:iron only hydrogenase large subunit-like protein